MIPLALTAGMLGLSFVPRVREHSTLIWSFWLAVVVLLVWLGWLRHHLQDAPPRGFDVALRKQHWIQAILHTSVYVYWGTYWPPVVHHFWLLVGQLLFCYAFDMLLAWSRRARYTLGFGPFPILFSTNLFLWFRDDWFYLQFLMLGVGFLGKEFVRWNRDGRRVHIFNPSAFSLGLFSLVLIVTGTTNLTWGDEIATTLNLAPQPYLFLFVLGLVPMYFFSITLVSAFSAAALFGLSALYMQIVGVPFFIDSEIPIAVFLGLHLLVTDPSTSPRTAPGKLIFGLLYGVTVFGLYELLGQFQQPTFYDKLLCVPLLNLAVQRIDQLAKKLPQTFLVGRAEGIAIPRRANLVHMAIWVAFFLLMAARGGADGRHTGDSLPFWQEACANDLRKGCATLALYEVLYCGDGSGWSCNEMGVHYVEGAIVDPDPEVAGALFAQACQQGFQPGCRNAANPAVPVRGDPARGDLRLLLSEGGLRLTDWSDAQLHARACEHGWAFACAR
ncbi:MAG: hypothetical protein O3A25_00120 [Acidobacteria bacterium]|nr:hypothetical protein [Acidobacteriota bacterium]